MPNKPAEDTVSVSFTLPRILAEAVEERAKTAMTNKSDIIRRALMNYLTEPERTMVLQEISEIQKKPLPQAQPASYTKKKRPQ